MDTIRVFGLRILKGKSPFAPDNTHIHHLMLDRGLSHRHITLCCVALNFVFVGLAYVSRYEGPTFVLLSMVSVSIASLVALIYWFKPVPQQRPETKHIITEDLSNITMTKVIPLNKEIVVNESSL